MRKLITLLLLTLCSSFIIAQTFTGTIDDDWAKPGNWFPSIVPTAGSFVTINAGSTCRIYLGTTAIITEVSFMGGDFIIDGILIIDGSPNDGLPIQGTVVVNGILGSVNAFGNGIRIFPGGQMTVNFGGNAATNVSVTGDGIFNQGIVQNNGTITITGAANNGFDNDGILSNVGALNILGAGNTGLLNNQSLTSTGQINISDSGTYGIFLAPGSPAFFNGGGIGISNSGMHGMRCDSDFTNVIGRTVTVTGSTDTGVQISSGVTAINNGLITIESSAQKGLYSDGDFTNGGILEINFSGFIALDNFAAASFTNNGFMTINTATIGISNVGFFINSPASIIEMLTTTAQGIIHGSVSAFDNSGEIYLQAIGTDGVQMTNLGAFSNSGVLSLAGGISYSSTGLFVNTGLLKGTGDIKGTHFSNVGDIAPGLLPGALTISETYDHGTGNYLAEIEPGVGNDLLILPDVVTGLGGVLTLTTTSTPSSGSLYTIISSPLTDISGMTFSIVDVPAGWVVIHTASTVDVMYMTPAPVEMIAFIGETRNDGILLEWNTAIEKNNDGFEVLKSVDGKHWNKIGWSAGHGDSNIEQNYAFLDTKPEGGANYYQLKQVDFDGTTEKTTVVVVQWKDDNQILIAPNPASGVVKVSVKNDFQPEEVVLIDISGRVVTKLDWNAGHVDLSAINAGTYFMKLKSGNKILTERIVVQ